MIEKYFCVYLLCELISTFFTFQLKTTKLNEMCKFKESYKARFLSPAGGAPSWLVDEFRSQLSANMGKKMHQLPVSPWKHRDQRSYPKKQDSRVLTGGRT